MFLYFIWFQLIFFHLDNILGQWHEKWLVRVPIPSIVDPKFPIQMLKDIRFFHNEHHSRYKCKAIRIPRKIAYLNNEKWLNGNFPFE